MIGERVIVTDKNNEFFNKELTVVDQFLSLESYWILSTLTETVCLRNDRFELVKNMVSVMIYGITYLVTPQERADIDAIVARNTKI